MNRLLAIAAALSIAAPVASQPLPGPIQATVVRVVDGDTLVVDAAVWPKIVVKASASALMVSTRRNVAASASKKSSLPKVQSL